MSALEKVLSHGLFEARQCAGVVFFKIVFELWKLKNSFHHISFT